MSIAKEAEEEVVVGVEVEADPAEADQVQGLILLKHFFIYLIRNRVKIVIFLKLSFPQCFWFKWFYLSKWLYI